MPRWRSEPYRVLFPLGMALAWGGVLHWLLLATGTIEAYRNAFHATAQIESFLAATAAGFLLTFLPRRTGAPPAPVPVIVLAGLLPIATEVAAWLEEDVFAACSFAALLALLAAVAVQSFRRATRNPFLPPSFAWLVAAALFGGAGALGWAAIAGRGEEWVVVADVLRNLLRQGVFASLLFGLGGVLFSLVTRGVKPPERGDPRLLAANVLGVLLFAATFAAEPWFPRLAYLGRGSVAVVAFGVGAGTFHPPTLPGMHRRLLWLATWLVPIGFWLVALFPAHRAAMLHVTLLGGFGLAAFAVSIHVALTHANAEAVLARWPARLVLTALALAVSLGARLLVSLDPSHFQRWLGLAALSFLAATILWAALVLPRLRERPIP